MMYAVGITPQKLAEVGKLNAAGADIAVITDDVEMAAAIAASPVRVRGLVEVDTGEGRGGLAPHEAGLEQVAAALGTSMAGVLTHAGHSYGGAQCGAARRGGGGRVCRHRRRRGPVTPGRFQRRHRLARQHTHGPARKPAGRRDRGARRRLHVRRPVPDAARQQRPERHRPDRADQRDRPPPGRKPLAGRCRRPRAVEGPQHEGAPIDYHYGLVLDAAGYPSLGGAVIRHAYQEHGVVDCDPSRPFPALPIGGKLRVAPNHACMTAAAHDRYYVVDGSDEVVAIWTRVNGW